jgi:hypothetical protein
MPSIQEQDSTSHEAVLNMRFMKVSIGACLLPRT